MRTHIKICGLMRKEDVDLCCRIGADICGFVVEYPVQVPWNLLREQCAELLPAVSRPAKTCVVTGGEREKIISLALELKPSLVQLHYHESLADTLAVVRALSPYGIGVIKTVPIHPEERLRQFGTEDAGRCAEALCAGGDYAVLVDSRSPSNAASGGGAADLSLFAQVKRAAACPAGLGGGITPENCREIIEKVNPDFLDVMTGVETAPGVKSEERIKKLLL